MMGGVGVSWTLSEAVGYEDSSLSLTVFPGEQGTTCILELGKS